MHLKEIKKIEIGRTYMVRRLDNSWHAAEVIHKRMSEEGGLPEYYVHYENFNRRLDEWVTGDRIVNDGIGVADNAEVNNMADSGDRKITRNQKRKHDEINHVQKSYAEMDPALAAVEKEYEAMTKIKYIDRIIMFRDGVGEGDLTYVKDTEIGAIKKCFSDNNIEDKVSLAYVIVSKRINTRFFATSGNGNGGKVSNPPSGTVVDDVVTMPERYDFFLVSQSVRQGTVNPTSYNVIHDTSGLKPAIMQKLAYKLTHLYYNWPGTVRVPAPCQYAHKLAKLAGESLHKEPSEKLENLLFYL